MAGIYIHIPFCRKACHYCNFHFSTSLHRKAELMEALSREICSQKMPFILPVSEPIETIYLGGGTPSILTIPELAKLFDSIFKIHFISSGAEITLEANPDDIHTENLFAWKSLGVNRLSIGVQSFRDKDLTWMNRAHNGRQALECIEKAAAAGFADLNIDLIYGTPTLPNDAWMQNLETARRLGITHLSCYALTIEENTALHHFVKRGKVPAPPEERQVVQFEMLMDWAETQGWEQYEISNLCFPGHRSRHNSHYWLGKPYLGYGPSAHSFDGKGMRWSGIANNALYINAWGQDGQNAYEVEDLSPQQIINEKIMTGLRRMEGILIGSDYRTIEGFALNDVQTNQFRKTLNHYLDLGFCINANNHIRLTRSGKLYADAIASALFV